MLLLLVGLLAVFAALIVVHEFIHACLFPGGPFGAHTTFGDLISRGMFYSFYDQDISRNRLLASVSAPFFVLSVLPTLLMICFGSYPFEIVFFTVIHTICAGGDLSTIAVVLTHIPSRVICRNKGYETWYKQTSESKFGN
jgi:hypothetical protein